MDKNTFAVNPPMGWNSYDYYDTTVNEEQVRANADYMAQHLKEYGWEYVVVDIAWYCYNPGTKRRVYQYIPFDKVEMDEYSRMLPCVERFPSSAGGKGFGPLADYVHSLGLKFGIHIMRGIPRQAAHQHTKIYGTDVTANEVADPSNICFWNPDMYGVFPDRKGAQEYYDSLFELYAQWGVDYVKCDDICRYDMPSSKKEIEMLYHAIQKCGRPIVLSLSPGAALIEEAWHYEKYANMWRITDDFWDNWKLLKNMFERCELWQNHVSQGCYPDCDMLPLGKIGKGFGQERDTLFTREEQVTMMTLWCIFRSPLMLGAELTRLDQWTLSLITNKEVLYLMNHSSGARQLFRDDSQAAWVTRDTEKGTRYIALFNLGDEEGEVAVSSREPQLEGIAGKRLKELWTGELSAAGAEGISAKLPAHGAKLYRVEE